ncbi:hypothetical protein [Chitinophaga sp. YR627]|uniref:hypothetical protein n=1 Tax=Chitinophaga sp. YR627 TaxID=1881041 RepID=UPI000B7F3699|nr:hypothetical protein [Chitinophaga sp. YR627]
MKQEAQHHLPIKPTLDDARQLLQADIYAYTDEEVTLIVDFIYRLAAIDLTIYEESLRNDTPVIHIKPYDDDHSTKSIPISEGKHRRTG